MYGVIGKLSHQRVQCLDLQNCRPMTSCIQRVKPDANRTSMQEYMFANSFVIIFVRSDINTNMIADKLSNLFVWYTIGKNMHECIH